MDRDYAIDELVGEKYNIAINNVIVIVNQTMGTSFFMPRNAFHIEELAQRLGVRFTAEGEIVRKAPELPRYYRE